MARCDDFYRNTHQCSPPQSLLSTVTYATLLVTFPIDQHGVQDASALAAAGRAITGDIGKKKDLILFFLLFFSGSFYRQLDQHCKQACKGVLLQLDRVLFRLGKETRKRKNTILQKNRTDE